MSEEEQGQSPVREASVPDEVSAQEAAEIKWLCEDWEKINISLDPPEEPEYVTYNVSLYDMRMEDAEGMITWIYSLCFPNEDFDPSKEVDPDQVLQQNFSIASVLEHLVEKKTSLDKAWLNVVSKKLLVITSELFAYTAGGKPVTWGGWIERAQETNDKYLEFIRQNRFSGKVYKRSFGGKISKRQIIPTSDPTPWSDVSQDGPKWATEE